MKTKYWQCRTAAVLGFAALATAAVILATGGCAGNQYDRSTGEYIDDHSLQVRADHALNENADYKFKDVSLVAFKGVVQLNGIVDLSDQKAKAADIVGHVSGVRSVENNILVADSNPRSAGEVTDDKALASRVRDALNNNPEYKFDGVTVAAYRGAVLLGGFVDTADQKTRAADLSKQVSGAKSVQNDITSKDAMKP